MKGSEIMDSYFIAMLILPLMIIYPISINIFEKYINKYIR